MKQTRPWPVWLGLGAVTIMGVTGCSSNGQNNAPDIQVPSANQVGKSVENAATTVEKVAVKAEKTAAPVVNQSIKTIATTAAPAVKAGEDNLMAGKIKTAIIANQTVDSSTINIDVKNNTVILRGRVKNAGEKALVQKIATQQASGYHLINQLQIVGATPKK